jgi:hypothetical protein
MHRDVCTQTTIEWLRLGQRWCPYLTCSTLEEVLPGAPVMAVPGDTLPVPWLLQRCIAPSTGVDVPLEKAWNLVPKTALLLLAPLPRPLETAAASETLDVNDPIE